MITCTFFTSGGFACGGDDSFEVLEQNLQGVIGGNEWTFVDGETNSFLSDETSFFTTLYASDIENCGFISSRGHHILASLPNEVGTFELDFFEGRTITLVSTGPDDVPVNNIATEGVIEITEITETSIKGGISAATDNDNTINGQFDISICPDDE